MKKILLVCLLFGFLGGEVLRLTIFNSISFRLLDIVAFVIFLSFVVDLLLHSENRKVFSTTPAKWLGGFFLIGALSLLVNIPSFSYLEIGEASLYLLRFIMYCGIFFYFSQMTQEEYTTETTILMITGSFLVLLGFVQYFYYNNLRNLYYLGWDDHMYRIFSVFLDPNFTGILFTLFALFLMGRILQEREKKKSVHFTGLTLLLGLTLVAIVMTFSRSALIALGAGTIVFLSLIGRKKYLFYFFGVMVGMILLATPFFYLENVNLFRVASSEARIESAENALSIIKDHFVTGVGFNTYRYSQIQYGFRGGVGAEVSHADSGTDNSYLFVLATTGIGGLFIYGGYLRSLILGAWGRYRKGKSLSAVLFLSSLIAVMLDSFFINSLFYPFVIVWLWLLWGRVNDR